jgi:hypothetical protein
MRARYALLAVAVMLPAVAASSYYCGQIIKQPLKTTMFYEDDLGEWAQNE